MKHRADHFDQGYREQLEGIYDPAVIEQVVNWQWADLSAQLGEVIPYVRVKPLDQEPAGRPVLFVPGFGEGIVNKASMAAECAKQGLEVILPGQNRKSILRDTANKRSAVYTQARNYLDVLAAATESGEKVDVMPHSFGMRIFDEMVDLEPALFEDSRVVALAPSNTVIGDNRRHLGRRWLTYLRAGMDQTRRMECPDPKGVTGKASAKVLLANIPRMWGESGDLTKRTIDCPALARAVGSLTVVSYAEDALYPAAKVSPLIEDAMQKLDEAGDMSVDFRWLSPVDPYQADGTPGSSARGATHDDEQFNPARVTRAIKQIFLSEAA